MFVAIVSDGAGSAGYGGEGASLICRSIGLAVRKHFLTNTELPTDSQIESWIDAARDRIFVTAQRLGTPPRDFAATLVFVVADRSNAVIAHVGDGCAAIKDEITAQWSVPLWPDHGEYASTTYFVTDEPVPKLRLTRYQGAISALVLFTDGLERLALDFASQQPFSKFFDGICRPLFSSAARGRDRSLSDALKRYLNSSPINDRTDDDKTLVLAVTK